MCDSNTEAATTMAVVTGRPIPMNQVADTTKEVGIRTLNNLQTHSLHMEGDNSKGAMTIDMAKAKRQAAAATVSSSTSMWANTEITCSQSEAMMLR